MRRWSAQRASVSRSSSIGLEREVINRHARGLEQDRERARRVDRDVPVRGRTRQRIDDEDRDPAHAVERCRPAQRVLGFQRFEDVEHTAQPEVVGDAAVDEMDVGSLCPVVVGLELGELPHHARDRPRRLGRVDEVRDPRGGRYPHVPP